MTLSFHQLYQPEEQPTKVCFTDIHVTEVIGDISQYQW